MYGLVLMAALTTGGEQTPNWFFHKHGCHGCYGCYGCCGCYGCYGCRGCHGGYGCYGAGYGGCYGYCYGGWGCYGSCAGAYAGCWGASYGCYGACYGGCAGFAPTFAPMPAGAMPYAPEMAPPPQPGAPKKSSGIEGAPSTRARLVIDLPAGAQLYVDDRPITAEGRKTFRTPELERGATYYYEVRAEMMRDGERVTETRRVTVRAGAELHEDFRNLATTATVRSR